MRTRVLQNRTGFTLIELAVVVGVLGALLLVSATLLAGTMNSYSKLTSETETIKKARHCLEMMSRDVRESVNFDIQNPNANPPLATTIDAMLLTSSRASDNTFVVDADSFPIPQSIVLYYLNQTNEGTAQLMRLQLFYAEDLVPNGLTPPFTLAPPPGPYNAASIVIVDNSATPKIIPINRVTGGAGGVLPLKPPQVLMTGSTSLDLVGFAPTPIEARLTCQFTDRFGRSTVTRLSTTIKARNL